MHDTRLNRVVLDKIHPYNTVFRLHIELISSESFLPANMIVGRWLNVAAPPNDVSAVCRDGREQSVGRNEGLVGILELKGDGRYGCYLIYDTKIKGGGTYYVLVMADSASKFKGRRTSKVTQQIKPGRRERRELIVTSR